MDLVVLGDLRADVLRCALFTRAPWSLCIALTRRPAGDDSSSVVAPLLCTLARLAGPTCCALGAVALRAWVALSLAGVQQRIQREARTARWSLRPHGGLVIGAAVCVDARRAERRDLASI